MRYAEFDYIEIGAINDKTIMARVWDNHWRGRKELKRDLSDEPLWPTIAEELKKPGIVLEAGCGTGQWVQFLGSLEYTVIGLDYAYSGLAVGRSCNPELTLVQGDFKKMPFKPESFDYIVSFGAIEHDIDGPEEALKEFRRVLKGDGCLMCSVPCLNFYRTISLPLLVLKRWLKCRKTLRYLWGKKAPFVFYEYMWSPGEYKSILENCGFRVLDIKGYGSSLKSRIGKSFDLVYGKINRLSSCHMMMAICQKTKKDNSIDK